MSEVVGLEITSNVSDFPLEKKFSAQLSLLDLKKKLELVVGALAENMKVELRDAEGRFLSTLSDDAATLRALGVKDGMALHVTDTSGGNEELQDGSMVEKYEMPDSAYDKREKSVRVWKKQELEKKKVLGGGQMETDGDNNIEVNSRCEVTVAGNPVRRGCVAFVGETKFAPGVWVGIVYDEAVGKNDGTVNGERYFECAPLHGGFVRPASVKTGEFPPQDSEMNEI